MYKQIILYAAMLTLLACNNPNSEKCLDCQGGDMTDEPTANLPCGGADLQSDNLNCGECGNECYVEQGDPRYQAGGCSEGKCGPRWIPKYMKDPVDWDLVLPPEVTCDEVCAEHETTCVAQGCVGLTAYTCASSWGDGCSRYEPSGLKDFAGECSEKVPWPLAESGYELEVDCCCAVRTDWD